MQYLSRAKINIRIYERNRNPSLRLKQEKICAEIPEIQTDKISSKKRRVHTSSSNPRKLRHWSFISMYFAKIFPSLLAKMASIYRDCKEQFWTAHFFVAKFPAVNRGPRLPLSPEFLHRDILLNQTEIRLYLPFLYWSVTKWTHVWF